jgi:hypothetical protein
MIFIIFYPFKTFINNHASAAMRQSWALSSPPLGEKAVFILPPSFSAKRKGKDGIYNKIAVVAVEPVETVEK